MQETLLPPKSHNRYRAAAKFCTRRAFTPEISLKNNDPLAPVYQLAAFGETELFDERLKQEFITDMAERSEAEHFVDEFKYSRVGNDLVSSTGLSLEGILNDGLRAAERDGIPYGIERAKALQAQMPKIIEWLDLGGHGQLAFFSLCPEMEEVSPEVAKKLNFKPHRKMSSNWIFEVSGGEIKMHAFSFDNHTLAMHQKLQNSLGLEAQVSSTLNVLSDPVILRFKDGTEAVGQIRKNLDDQLDSTGTDRSHYFGIAGGKSRASSNELVKRHPEALVLYRQAIHAVTESLNIGRVSRNLAALNRQLRSVYKGEAPINCINLRLFRAYKPADAAELIEYLRSQAIPHFIYGNEGNKTIAASGASAVSSKKVYVGACPTSVQLTAEQSLSMERARLDIVLYGKLPNRESVIYDTCPCCLPKPEPGEVVHAWKSEGFIGCDDCGHIVDVCTGVVMRGNPNVRMKNKKKTQTKSKKENKYPKPKTTWIGSTFWGKPRLTPSGPRSHARASGVRLLGQHQSELQDKPSVSHGIF